MGRPRSKPWERKPPVFKEGQLVEPIEAYVGEVDGVHYSGFPGKTRLDGGHPAVQEWPHLHKLIDPKAYDDRAVS
jgi:hypothetical protein